MSDTTKTEAAEAVAQTPLDLFNEALKAQIMLLCSEDGLCGDAQAIPFRALRLGVIPRRENRSITVPVVAGSVVLTFSVVSDAELAQRALRWVKDTNYASVHDLQLDTTALAEQATGDAGIDLAAAVASTDPAVVTRKAEVRAFAQTMINEGRIYRTTVNKRLALLGIEELAGPKRFTFQVPLVAPVGQYEITALTPEAALEDLKAALESDQSNGRVRSGATGHWKVSSDAEPTLIKTVDIN